MAGNAIFPMYLRTEYLDTPNGLQAFQTALNQSLNKARQTTTATMAEIERTISKAMVAGSRGGFEFDVAGARAASQAADARAAAARQIATAVASAAVAETNYTTAARVAAAATANVADQEEQAALAARLHANSAAYVAKVMGTATTASTRMATATGKGGYASVMAAQQFQDFFIQVQGGQSALVAFSQQASQLAVVMQGASGGAGIFARFMGGPWGTAVLAAVSIGGLLVNTMKSATSALEDVKFSSGGVSDAQSILSGVMDLTTGKMKDQTEAAIGLALAQAKLAQIRAQVRAEELRGSVKDLQQNTWGGGGGLGGGFALYQATPGALKSISRDVLAHIDNPKIGITTAEAVERLDSLRKVGQLTDEEYANAAASVASLGVELNNIETNKSLERLLKGEGTSGDRSLLLTPKKPSKEAENRAKALAEFGASAAEQILRVNEAWDQQPKLIDRANQATRQLDALIEKLGKEKPAGFEKMIADATKAKDVVQAGLVRPYDDLVARQYEQLAVQDLVVRGRQDEADALSMILGLQHQMGPLSEEQAATVTRNLAALRQQSREMDIQRQKQAAYLDALGGIQSGITSALAGARTQGLGSLGSIGKSFTAGFDQLFASVSFDKIFGEAFRGMEDGVTGVKRSGEMLSDTMLETARTVEILGNASAAAANKAAGKVVANDNSHTAADAAAIIVNGRKQGFNTDPVGFLGDVVNRSVRSVVGKDSPLADAIGDEIKKLTKFFEGTGSGVVTGAVAGGLVLGGNNFGAGSALGGALGKKLGDSLASGPVGDALGKLSGALGPLGSIAGGLLGGALGSLFTSTKKGVATIGGNSAGDLVVTSLTGNSGKRKQAASEGADSTISSIEKIAAALGATVNASAGSVSIGVRDGNYRVDPTGQGYTKLKNGALDFGSDAASAAKAATLDLIKDGVLVGLRAGSATLLKNAKDLETGLEKALKFQTVFDDYRALIDPVGAAVNGVNRKFTDLQKVFAEAGASAEDLATLEKLYNSPRKSAAEEAAKAATGSLQDLIDNLTIGDSGYSLKTRIANAQAAYDPLAARVQSGDVTAFDDYSSAAQTLLDLNRQMYGSQQQYFDIADSIKAITSGAISDQQKLIDAANGSASVFDTTPVVSATERQTAILSDKLDALIASAAANNDNMGKLLAKTGTTGSSGSSWLSGRGNF